MDLQDRNDADELQPGYILGNYEILASIGLGGMARVYRACHQTTGEMVALKVMERSLLNSAASRRRFVREGKTASSVKHPNVVRMLDVGAWNDLPFIAMELLSGLDLDSYIQKRGPLPEAEIVAIALPIIAGVGAVHQAGVVHRDLKPSNIFLATDSNGMAVPKLLDFGISKVHGSLLETDTRATGSREIIGTPAYLSPEALNGSRELGPLSDQYSLGVVLYECAVGRSPYAGNTLLQLLQSLAAGKVLSPRELRPDLSPALDAVIRRAMMTSPGARYADIDELGRALWALSEEPARAIWASQFGEANYTAPILGSATTPIGMTAPNLVIPQGTPAPSAGAIVKKRQTKEAVFMAVGLAALCVSVAVVLIPWAQSESAAVGTEPEFVQGREFSTSKAERKTFVVEKRQPPEPRAKQEMLTLDVSELNKPVTDTLLEPVLIEVVQAALPQEAASEMSILPTRKLQRVQPTRRARRRSNQRAKSRVQVRKRQEQKVVKVSPPVLKTEAVAAPSEKSKRLDEDLSELFSLDENQPGTRNSKNAQKGPNGAPLLD